MPNHCNSGLIKTTIQSALFSVFFLLFYSPTVHAQEPPPGDSIRSFNGKQYVRFDSVWNVFYQGHFFPILGYYITVRYNVGADRGEIAGLVSELDIHVKDSNKLGFFTYEIPHNADIFNIATIMASSGFIDDVNINSQVLGNKPDIIGGGSSACIPYDVNCTKAWDITCGSSTIKVGIIDSGIDWKNRDLGHGTSFVGDTSSNIYENPGEDAWADSTDPTTGDGIDNDGNGYIDDWKGWNFLDGNNNTLPDPGWYYAHGTSVAGVVAEKSNNNHLIDGVAGGYGLLTPGSEAGVKVIPIKVSEQIADPNITSNYEIINGMAVDEAIIYAVDMGARIINMSFWCDSIPEIDAALDYAYDHDVLVTSAVGNDDGNAVVYPARYKNVVAVSSYTFNGSPDVHSLSNFSNKGPQVTLAARGKNVCVLLPETNWGLGADLAQGTSFAAPFVAGVAALMLSVNRCLTRQQLIDIMKSTARKIGNQANGSTPIDYNWNSADPGHSQEFGYGIVQADPSVEVAYQMTGEDHDLYLKDCPQDWGITNDSILIDIFGTYPAASDQSPDIWVRNMPDGLTNDQHENPEYTQGQPTYVYVRVRNKGCLPSIGTEKVKIYWSKAASWFSWPQNFDGTNPAIGDQIGTATIAAGLQPGADTILQFPWSFDSTLLANGGNVCLLARIEATPDSITEYVMEPDMIFYNNNVAIRNTTIVNIHPNKPPPMIGGAEYPYGGFMYLANPTNTSSMFNIHFDTPDDLAIKDITEEAEVTIRFDSAGWNALMHSTAYLQDGVTVVSRNKSLILSNPSIVLDSVMFPVNAALPIYVGFSFLTRELTENKEYNYRVSQAYTANPGKKLGTENYVVRKSDREPFTADAGPDKTILPNQNTTLSAIEIPEAVTYRWYDSRDSLVHTGRIMSVSPSNNETYKLEVTAEDDGFKDYDEVDVKIKAGRIVTLYPNPTSSLISLEYEFENVSSAYIYVIKPFFSSYTVYSLDVAESSTEIDLSDYSAGIYNFVLICDGAVADVKSVTKQ